MSLPSVRRRLSAASCVLLAAAACGKKGPPLAPFPDLPAAVTDLSARRAGADLVLQFTVPAANVDGRRPANLVRVEVYGADRRLPRPADYLERGRLVGSVAVRRVAPAGADVKGAPDLRLEQGARAAIAVAPDAPLAPRAAEDRDRGVEPVADPVAAALPAVFPDGGGPLVPARGSRFATRYTSGRASTAAAVAARPRPWSRCRSSRRPPRRSRSI